MEQLMRLQVRASGSFRVRELFHSMNFSSIRDIS